MAVTHAQKLRLGLFVSAAIAIFVVAMILLAGMKFIEKRDYYEIRFSDAETSLSGLDIGSAVKYSGIKIGRIEAVHVDPQDVGVIVVQISLDDGTPVAEDSVANLGSMGITGLKFVELTRGSKSARIRAPGEEIPAGKSLLDNLAGQADVIVDKVNDVLSQIRTITGPEMQQRVDSIAQSTDAILKEVHGILTENRENLNKLLGNVTRMSDELTEVLHELNGSTKRINRILDSAQRLVDNADKGVAQLAPTLEAARKFLNEANVALGQNGALQTLDTLNVALTRITNLIVQSRDNLLETIRSAREVAENLAIFSEKIKDDPSLLILGESNGDP